jgi:hypothetical protein
MQKQFRLAREKSGQVGKKCEEISGWTGNLIGKGRDRGERPRPGELEIVDAKTSRGPQHFPGPPRNETDITQNKNFRQCVFAVRAEKDLETSSRRSRVDKK